MPLCTVDIPTACRGVREVESGINIKSYRQRTSDEREYLRDSDGTVTGFFHCFNLMQEGTIEGEIVTDITAGEGKQARFSDIIQTVFAQVPTEGLLIGEMRDRLAMLEACEGAGTEIEVPESVVPILKETIANHRWPAINQALVDLTDAVAAL